MNLLCASHLPQQFSAGIPIASDILTGATGWENSDRGAALPGTTPQAVFPPTTTTSAKQVEITFDDSYGGDACSEGDATGGFCR
jgi:hypothetical protein